MGPGVGGVETSPRLDRLGPMSPQVEWRDGIGLRARWDEIDTIVELHWYSFVEERHFPSRDLDSRLELPARNVTLLRESERATDYAAIENRVINRSVNVERIERASGRAVLRQRVMDGGSAGRGVEVRGRRDLHIAPGLKERRQTARHAKSKRRDERQIRPPNKFAAAKRPNNAGSKHSRRANGRRWRTGSE